ncbi:MAG: type II toxin-antitoxin system VapC family toxin [Frankiales bacterium]|nr:type II toxin-antitoxin system VapC family toxin [Frankiales bacterium]
MRVLDASVVVDALVVSGVQGDLARLVLATESVLHVPAVFLAEVSSALRAMVHRGDVDPGAARTALDQVAGLSRDDYPLDPFLPRVWELRANVTVYDGWYVALAESMDVPLVTADSRLLRAAGPHCPVLTPEQAVG